MRFSERFGHKPVRLELQKESIDDALRAGLWTAVSTQVFEFRFVYNDWEERYFRVSKRCMVYFFKRPIDEAPSSADEFVERIRKWFFKADWHQIYDFIEFVSVPDNSGFHEQDNRAIKFPEMVNSFLEMEKSAYRLINCQIIPITSEKELEEVAAVGQLSGKFAPVAKHISAAVALYANRRSPDYRNSVKEAISAVESAVKIMTGNDKATLGDALKKLGEHHQLHPALKEALSKLYGYTNDAGGIRHAMLEASNIDEPDARFMLVVCSAFSNLLIERSQKVRE